MQQVNWPAFFQRVYCINLRRRRDRWRDFELQQPDDWPFAPIERVEAIDARRCPPPERWTAGPGAWGCYRSHLRLIEDALNRGLRSILIFEDDAVFCKNFVQRTCRFLAAVPDDWEMLYLGGQLLKLRKQSPRRVNTRVWQPFHVSRTHAYAVHRRMLPALYEFLCASCSGRGGHIDHHLGALHETEQHQIYCPTSWLVGQAAGHSDISQRKAHLRFWSPAEESRYQKAYRLEPRD